MLCASDSMNIPCVYDWLGNIPFSVALNQSSWITFKTLNRDLLKDSPVVVDFKSREKHQKSSSISIKHHQNIIKTQVFIGVSPCKKIHLQRSKHQFLQLSHAMFPTAPPARAFWATLWSMAMLPVLALLRRPWRSSRAWRGSNRQRSLEISWRWLENIGLYWDILEKYWVILGYTGEILGYTAIYWDIRVSRWELVYSIMCGKYWRIVIHDIHGYTGKDWIFTYIY